MPHDQTVDVRLLTVTDCPHRDLTLRRVREALARVGVPQIAVIERVVDDPTDAAARGMRGSPTVLIDGHDPFATADTTTSVSCRMYPTATGYDGAPSVDHLVAALTHATARPR